MLLYVHCTKTACRLKWQFFFIKCYLKFCLTLWLIGVPPSQYAPDEIQNSMFLPLMKIALMGKIGGRL